MMKRIMTFAIAIILMLTAACNKEKDGKSGEEADFKYYAYFLNTEKNKLVREGIDPSLFDGFELNDAIGTMIDFLKNPSDPQNASVLSDDVRIKNFEIVNQQLILDFSSGYLELNSDIEILIRAAIVKSFAQIDKIQKISFLIDSQPLTDSNDKIIGPMDRNSFVENMGTDINTYQEDIIYLYFADLNYKQLIKTGIKVMRRTNIPREKTILEYLFKGPIKEFENEVVATIPNELKINSIITKNGVCYIDFSEKNITSESAVPSELVIYSMVNSVTEDSSIIKVKFSVDSNEAAVYKGIKLDEAFERKDSLVKEE